MTSENISRKGVNAVEAIFLGMGWIFREQPISDYGIDAQVEIVDDGKPTGQLIALQIKSGAAYFRTRGAGYVFYGDPRHLDYWDSHSLPVLLILHDPETQTTLWTKIERHLVTVGQNGNWSVEIPAYMTLSSDSAHYVAQSIPRSDPESTRRRRMSLDIQTIQEINDHDEVYLTADEWVNKSLNFRGAEIFFEDPEFGQSTYKFDFYYPGRGITSLMDFLFPWLDYEYDRPPDDPNPEIRVHTFAVTVNDLGKAFLKLEDFYRNGSEPRNEPEPPSSVDDDPYDDDV
jgi:hypothetical protein